VYDVRRFVIEIQGRSVMAELLVSYQAYFASSCRGLVLRFAAFMTKKDDHLITSLIIRL